MVCDPLKTSKDLSNKVFDLLSEAHEIACGFDKTDPIFFQNETETGPYANQASGTDNDKHCLWNAHMGMARLKEGLFQFREAAEAYRMGVCTAMRDVKNDRRANALKRASEKFMWSYEECGDDLDRLMSDTMKEAECLTRLAAGYTEMYFAYDGMYRSKLFTEASKYFQAALEKFKKAENVCVAGGRKASYQQAITDYNRLKPVDEKTVNPKEGLTLPL